MSKKEKCMLGVLLVVFLLFMLYATAWTAACVGCVTHLTYKVKNQDYIESVLEVSDQQRYADVREELSEIIREDYEVDPDEVCFWITGKEIQKTYSVQVFFNEDGVWKTFIMDWRDIRISAELDKRLLEIWLYENEHE